MTDVLKQSLMLVLSLGGAVALLTSTGGDDEAAKSAEETAQVAPPPAAEIDEDAAYWAEEDEEDEFVFGEPMADTDPVDSDSGDDKDDGDSSDKSGGKSAAYASSGRKSGDVIDRLPARALVDGGKGKGVTPADGMPGSASNPVAASAPAATNRR